MKIALAILPNGMVNSHLGSAKKVAIVTVKEKEIVDWQEVSVPFADNHDRHTHHHDHGHHHDNHTHHGAGHHSDIRDFMIDNDIDVALVEHIGPGIKAAVADTKVKFVVVDVRHKAKEVVQNYINEVL